MVGSNLALRTNFYLYEINKNKRDMIYKSHNAVTKTGLHIITQRILNLPLNSNYTNHFLNLFAMGSGASDISTIPSPASPFDQVLINPIPIISTDELQVVNVNNISYIDIKNFLLYTTPSSWKLSIVITNEIFNNNSGGPQFVNEFGLYCSTELFNDPVLFARITTAPFIFKTNRMYLLEWHFSLSFMTT